MKSSVLLPFLAASLFLTGCQDEKKKADNGKTIGNLYLSEAKPNPGDQLQISYSNENSKDVAGYYYYLVNSNVHASDLDLKDSMGIWKTTLQIPDSATAIGFNFKVNDTFDTNNKKGYVLPLYTEKGEIVPGGKASEGFYHLWMDSYFGLETGQDSALSFIGSDLQKHPKLKQEWDQNYAWRLYNADSEKGGTYINERIVYYSGLKNPSEEDFSTLILLNRILNNSEKVDSLQKLTAEKFPKGDAAKSNFYIKFRKTADLAEQEKMLAEFDAKFGEGSYKDLMVQTIANTYLAQGNRDKFLEVSERISSKEDLASLYNNAAWNLAEKGGNMEFAAKISKRSLELLDASKENKEGKPDYFSESQYVENLERNYEMYADTYAFILFKQGKTEEALSYQKMALGNGKSSDINERYVQYLVAAENWEMARKTASNYIRENVATAKTKEYFETAYVKATGSEKGLEEKLAALEKEAHAKILAQIKEEMMNEASPNFSMKDAQGNEISLASLKGKTVVLDFWATWCGPCKASFPGMQLAVEKYKDNPEVAFFFVNTFENAGTYEARQKNVMNFIESNDYDFHVLFDQPKEEGSRKFETADGYGITGIPTKIILGPDGNIKFKEVGYGGNNEAMLQKIDIMIELSKS